MMMGDDVDDDDDDDDGDDGVKVVAVMREKWRDAGYMQALRWLRLVWPTTPFCLASQHPNDLNICS
jgi:hypothetical protein